MSTRQGNRGDTGDKPTIEKRETKQLKVKAQLTPPHKNISPNCHPEDTSSEGNGKKLAVTCARSNRLISLPNDEFKDFQLWGCPRTSKG